MRTPLTFDMYAQPICLPPPDQRLEGRNATVVGWGWLNEIDKVKAKRLQKVEVPVLNNSICAKWYSDEYDGYVQIHDYQICAGYKEGGRDACQGDSGGPLIMKEGKTFSIIGIVSAGVGCARKQLPGIYSRVSVFVNWIQKVAGNSL
ncbi:Plasma kallikrein, partial [Stegodyphus mimosarum]